MNQQVTEAKRDYARRELERLLRRAALHVDHRARLQPLADKMGVRLDRIRLSINRGYLSKPLCKLVEFISANDVTVSMLDAVSIPAPPRGRPGRKDDDVL